MLARHRDALRRLIGLRIDPALGRRVDASDIVQDVLLEADRRLVEYLAAAKMPFHLWLRCLARDRLIDAHRHHRRAQRRSLDREQALPQAPGPINRRSIWPIWFATGKPRRPRPRSAASSSCDSRRRSTELDETDREIVLLRHFEQLSNGETAEVLGLSPPAAGMRYLRAMRRLRSLLDEVPSAKGIG